MPVIQLVILVLDASGSMAGNISNSGITKARIVEDLICRPLHETLDSTQDKALVLQNCGLVARLQSTMRRDTTDLGIIRFDTSAEVWQNEIRPVLEWELSPVGTDLSTSQSGHYILGGQPFDLLAGKGGGSNIASALRLAHDMARDYVEHWLYQKGDFDPFVSIVLTSDMLLNEGSSQEIISIASQIKKSSMRSGQKRILLAAAAIGDDADIGLMREIASAPDYSVSVLNQNTLRSFVLSSISSQYESDFNWSSDYVTTAPIKTPLRNKISVENRPRIMKEKSATTFTLSSKSDFKLTMHNLETDLMPYLLSISQLQEIIDQLQQKPSHEIAVKLIKQNSPVSVNLDGASDAIALLRETITPWRKKHAESMARLAEQEKQVAIENGKAEVLAKRASAEKERTEVKRLQIEISKGQEEANRLKLENEKLRLEIQREKIQLALELLAQVTSNLSEVDKINFLLKLLQPLEALTESELEIK